MRQILVSCFMLLPMLSLASDLEFNWLTSTTGENSALSGKCDYIDSSLVMNCNLRQMSVRKLLSEAEVKQQQDETIKEFDTELKNQSASEYVSKNFDDACKKMSEVIEKIDQLDESKRNEYNRFSDICDNPTREKILNLFLSTITLQSETCKVFEWDTGDFVFKPVNDNKWVSTNEPIGECGIVVIATLERDPTHHALWEYSQIKHYTNQTSELCKEFKENGGNMSYSWNSKSPIEMNCKYIEFGL
jgi:hypothetical protein